MAFAAVGALGTAQTKTAGTTVTLITGRIVPIKDVCVVYAAFDNIDTADAASSRLTCTDSKGNTWTKIAEFTKGSGTAAAGVTGALWVSRITVALTATDTIVITGTSVAAKTVAGHQFSMDATATLVVQATATTFGTTGPGSITWSPLPIPYWHCLSLYMIGSENAAVTAGAPGGYTALTTIGSTGGATATNVSALCSYQIGMMGSPNPPNPVASPTPSGDFIVIGALLREEFPQTDHTIAPADTVSLVDNQSQAVGYVDQEADTVTLSDNLQAVLDLGLATADTVTLADSLGLQADWVLTLSDSVVLDDAFDGQSLYVTSGCRDDAIAGAATTTGDTVTGTFWACATVAPLGLGTTLPIVTLSTPDSPPPAGLALGAVPPVVGQLYIVPAAGLALGAFAPTVAINISVDAPVAGLGLGSRLPAYLMSQSPPVLSAGLGLGAHPVDAYVIYLFPVDCNAVDLTKDTVLTPSLVAAGVTTINLDPVECH